MKKIAIAVALLASTSTTVMANDWYAGIGAMRTNAHKTQDFNFSTQLPTGQYTMDNTFKVDSAYLVAGHRFNDYFAIEGRLGVSGGADEWKADQTVEVPSYAIGQTDTYNSNVLVEINPKWFSALYAVARYPIDMDGWRIAPKVAYGYNRIKSESSVTFGHNEIIHDPLYLHHTQVHSIVRVTPYQEVTVADSNYFVTGAWELGLDVEHGSYTFSLAYGEQTKSSVDTDYLTAQITYDF